MTLGIDDKTMQKWKKGLKKLDPNTLNVTYVPVITPTAPSAPPPVQSLNDLTKVFDDFFKAKSSDTDIIQYGSEIWKINFPKVAEDIIDPAAFKQNVTTAVIGYYRINFPIEVEVAKNVKMIIETMEVGKDEYLHYPSVTFKPTFEGHRGAISEFMSKLTGKITGMRLTNLAYNIPDRFSGDTPIGYTEKILV